MTRDPENRLFSRADVQRLEAEAIRDALLAVSDQLDPTMCGTLLKLKNREYFFDHTSKDLTTYDSVRRSLYLPIVRNNVFDLFQLLDFPDPTVSSSDRSTTVVAPQALLMLNSEFMMQSAAKFADRLMAETNDDTQRLMQMYVIAYGREPTADEQKADRTLLNILAETQLDSHDGAEKDRRAWTALCHVVFAANEFIYLK